MFRLGEKQVLTVIKKVDFGVFLAERADSQERVLLPKKYVPRGTKPRDALEVFLYKDSADRLIATTLQPKLELGKIAVLRVAQVNRFGAFLDWGLEKELFLPYKEQLFRVREGDEFLATLYIDKSERLCATMKGLYHLLSSDSPYEKEMTVSGRVYEFSDNFGTFVAVDDKYSARIPKHEGTKDLRIGQVIEARVTDVKADGKLDLTMRKRAHLQIEEDADRLLRVIDEFAGALPFNDKASPAVILRETGLSKAAFKRAAGHLYKERKIIFTEKGIRKI